jgi:hypothetical protein
MVCDDHTCTTDSTIYTYMLFKCQDTPSFLDEQLAFYGNLISLKNLVGAYPPTVTYFTLKIGRF